MTPDNPHPSGLAIVRWFDAAQNTYGTATVYCAAVEQSGRRDSGYWPSYTYVCPECGQAWMREEWSHKFHYRSLVGGLWKVRERLCRWHGGGFLLDDLPLESCDARILGRELALYFDQYDHDNNTGYTRYLPGRFAARTEGAPRRPDGDGQDHSPRDRSTVVL